MELLLGTLAAAVLLLFFAGGAARAAQGECPPCGGASLVPTSLGIELPRLQLTTATIDLRHAALTAHGERADVRVDSVLGMAAARSLARDLDRAVDEVEAAFGRAFTVRPALYAYASRDAFVAGMRDDFGYDPAAAALLARGHAGVFDPEHALVAIDRGAMTPATLPSLLRHELAHALVRQLARGVQDVPAWIDEGLATLAERRVVSARDRAIALSLLRSGNVTLDGIGTPALWLARDGDLGMISYSVAALAETALEADLGRAGIVDLLDEAGSRGSFSVAYEERTGRSLEWFTSTFAARVAPGATITTEVGAALTSWSLTGFGRGELVSLTIDGPDYHLAYAVTADGAGTYWGTLGGTMPAGEYLLVARGATDTASTVVRVEAAP